MSNVLNKNPMITISVAAVVILLSLYFTIKGLMSDPVYEPPEKETTPLVWFYDRNTKELFTMPVHEVGPVERDSGPFNGEPAGVRAHVFACGDCGSGTQFVGYLERPSPREAETADTKILETDLTPLISTPDSNAWIAADSAAGSRIMDSIHSRCTNGQKANYCRAKQAKE